MDASDRGVGAVLAQKDSKDQDHPIAYYSRKMLPRERHYSAADKEGLTLISAVRHFEVYLVGRHFIIITDHRALLHITKLRHTSGCLARWADVQALIFRFNTDKAKTIRMQIASPNRDGWRKKISAKILRSGRC